MELDLEEEKRGQGMDFSSAWEGPKGVALLPANRYE
jgi:hypothetical protein